MDHVNITDSGRNWRLGTRKIINLKTMESRTIDCTPVREATYMHEREFVRKCAEAFETGKWPEK